MAVVVSKSVIVPTEADGWHVLQDPQFECIYWRCRALVIESGVWWNNNHWNGPWIPLDREHWVHLDSYYENNKKRQAIWQALFLNP